MKPLITGLLLLIFSLNVSASLILKDNFESEGQKIIGKIRNHFLDFKGRGYQRPPSVFTSVLMFAPLFNSKQIDSRTLEMSLQHDYILFNEIAKFTENYICSTKTGRQICDLYLKRQALVYPGLSYGSIERALSGGIILAISEDRKILESWSSNYTMTLFINPNTVSVQGLARRIIHEMFQIIDPKNSVSSIVDRLKKVSEKEMCKAAALNSNLHIRYITSALRSFKIEDQVVQEMLGAKAAQLDFLRRNSCRRNIDWAESVMRDFFREFDVREKPNIINVPLSCYDIEHGSMTTTIFDSEFAVAVEWMDLEKPLCEFLSDPALNQISGDVRSEFDMLESFHGPRPGIGTP